MGASSSKRDLRRENSKLSLRNRSMIRNKKKSLRKEMIYKLAISKQHHFANFIYYAFTPIEGTDQQSDNNMHMSMSSYEQTDAPEQTQQ